MCVSVCSVCVCVCVCVIVCVLCDCVCVFDMRLMFYCIVKVDDENILIQNHLCGGSFYSEKCCSINFGLKK